MKRTEIEACLEAIELIKLNLEKLKNDWDYSEAGKRRRQEWAHYSLKNLDQVKLRINFEREKNLRASFNSPMREKVSTFKLWEKHFNRRANKVRERMKKERKKK